jgi:GTP-binding protein EngB required for normal cell division
MSKIVSEANRIAAELAENKIFVSSVPGTALSDICNSVISAPIITNKNTPGGVELTQDRLDGYEADNLPARLSKLREYAAVGIEAVNRHLAFTRNTVSPLIRTLVENFERAKAGYSEVAKEYKVIVDVSPEPLVNSSFTEYLDSKYGTRPKTILRPTKSHLGLSQDVTIENLFELLKMGAASVDEDIKKWVERIGTDKAISVYRGTFTEIGGNPTYDSIMNSNDIDGILLIHLFANSLFDNPPPNTTKYSLAEYNEAVGDLRNVTGFRLTALLDTKETLVKAKLLITGRNVTTVNVNRTVYEEFMEQGGTDAALLGTLVSTNRLEYLNEILSNKDKLSSEFIAFTKLDKVSENIRNNENNKFAMKEALLLTISSNWDKCYGHIYPGSSTTNFEIPEYKHQLELIRKIVSDIPIGAFDQLPHLCTALICDIIYPDTGAKMILSGIDRAVAKDKDLDLSQAALTSTIEYILEYVFDQLVIH